MFAWARTNDLSGVDLSTHADPLAAWGPVWAYGVIKPERTETTLCINSECLSRMLVQSGVCNVVTAPVIDGSLGDGDFDLVYYCYPDMNNVTMSALAGSLQGTVRPGGRVVLVQRCDVAAVNSVDYASLFENGPFMPYRAAQFEPIPSHVRLNADWFDGRPDVLIMLDTSGTRFAQCGLVFFRTYSVAELVGRSFVVNKSRVCSSGSCFVEDLAGYTDPSGVYNGSRERTFWIPDALLNGAAIDIHRIADCYGTNLYDAATLLSELVCLGFLRRD